MKLKLNLLCLLFLITGMLQAQNTVTVTYTTTGGVYLLTVPSGVTVVAEAWGGGGGGGGARNGNAAGGGGGGYMKKTFPNLILPMNVFNINVGAGGTGGGAPAGGADAGGSGGQSRVHYDGINYDANGGRYGQYRFTPGGTGNSENSPGGTAVNGDINTTGGTGRSGDNGSNGGGGANGGAGGPGTATSAAARNGAAPGGGGAGGRVSGLGAAAGGRGARGQVVLTIAIPNPAITSPSLQICGGGGATLNVTNPSSGVTYTWYMEGMVVGTGSSFNATQVGSYNVRAQYGFPVLGGVPDFAPALGSGNVFTTPLSNTITLTAGPALQVNPVTLDVCSGENASITPLNGVHGTIPTGTSYVWTRVSANGTTGSSSGGSGAVISLGQIYNTTNEIQTVVYTVVPSGGGCTGSSFQLSVNVKPMPQINPMTRTICSEQSINIAPVDGTDGIVPSGTGYSWTVSNSGGVLGTTSGTGALISLGTLGNTTDLPKTAIYAVSPEANGCAGASFQIEVIVNPALVATLIADYDSYCAGGHAELTASAVPAGTYIYDWYLDNALIYPNVGNTITVADPVRTTPYNYHVVVREGLCESVSNSVGITVKALPTATVTVNHSNICPDGSITATANVMPSGNYDYVWYLDGNVTGFNQTLTLNNLSVGAHQLYVEVMPVMLYNGCDIVSAPITITVHDNPVVTIAASETAICAGEAANVYVDNVVIDSEVSGSYAYQWALNGVEIPNAIMSSFSRMLDNAGTYEFTMRIAVNNGLGCASDWSAPVVVTAEALPQVSIFGDYDTVCAGGSVTLTAAALPAGNYTYEWYQDNTLVASGSSNTYTSSGLLPRAMAYNYYVVARSPLGCEGTSNSFPIMVKNLPVVTVLTNHSDICQGGNITATAQIMSAEAYFYTWYLDGLPKGFGQEITLNNLSVGAQELYVEAMPVMLYNGCEVTSAPTTITVHNNPVVTIAAAETALCAEETVQLYTDNIQIDAEVDGSYSCQWALNGIDIPNALMSSYSRMLDNAGSYVFTMKLTVNNGLGCASDWSAPVVVTVDALPQVSLSVNNNSYCEGGSALLTANLTPVGNYTYDWYLDNVLVVSNNNNTYLSTGLTPQLTPYNYQVVVRSASGCEGRSNVLGLTVVAVPTVSITTDYTEICREGNIIATASIMSAGNYEHFIWQWAVNGSIISNATQSIYTQTLEAGIYVFTARMIQNDGLGCASDWSNPVTVTVKDIEVPAFFTTDCGEENTGSYRTVHVPIDVHFGNPQSYAISFVDAAHASLNRSGLVVHNVPSGAYIEARLPLRAGDYEMIIDIDGCLYTAIGRVLVDASAMGGANLIEQRWNDVLTVNNNQATNGGFTFYSYQWYKNGVLIPGATKQSYTEPDGRLNGAYHVELLGYAILASNQTAPISYVSCPFTPSPQFSMRVYPVPVGRNQSLTFETSLTADELAGARIEIYDMAGSLQRSISNLSPTMTISGFNNTGIYIGRIITQNDEVTTIQFLVQ